MRVRTKYITSPRDDNTNRVDDFVSVILLSENSGYRMKSYGPIPLLKIGARCLIDIQIQEIKSVFNNFEIILCSGFGSHKIIKYIRDKYPNLNVRVVENQIYEYSNSCESLRLCLNNTPNNKLLVCSGELMINREVLSLTTLKKSFIISEVDGNKNLEVGVTVNEKGFTENFCYGISNIWSEILFLNNSDIIDTVRGIISDAEYKNKFIFEALNDLSRTKHKLSVILNDKQPLTKLSNIKTYHEVRKQNENTSTKLH